MMRPRSLLIGLPLVCLLSACVVNTTLTVSKTMAVQAPSAGSVTQNVLVDLAQVQEIKDHRNNVRSLDLDYLEVTVAQVNAANRATTLTATIKLRKTAGDTAHDVVVGSLTNVAIQRGTTVRLNGTPQADAFLLDALQTADSFYVVIEGSVAGGAADLVMNVDLHASLGYEVF